MSEAWRPIRDALLVLALAVLLLLALEGAARLLGIGAPESVEFAAKPPGTFRILAAGGSTVRGVPDGAQGFVAQLERGLRRAAPGRPLEVRNLAQSGVGSSEVLATLQRATAESQPDLSIVLIGHNEFLSPPPGPLQRLRNASRLARAVSRLTPWDTASAEPFPDQLVPIERGSDDFRHVVERFQQNLDALVRLAGDTGVPLLLCTAPANLADWPPAHRRVLRRDASPGDAERIAEIQRLLATERFDAAAQAAAAALATRPEDALLLQLGGRALRALGRADEARTHFERARDLDPIPRRAFGAFNDAVRAHAGAPGVFIVDLERRFAEHARAGLVGFELVCDNCHPTPKGHAIIARELAAVMAEAGLFLAQGAPVAPLDVWLARNAASLGDATERRRQRLRWLLSNAIYSMKTPFFNYEASRYYLAQARALAPNDWRVHANLATLDFLTGDLQAGRRALRRATALRGEPLDPRDRRVTPYLLEALESAGIPLPPPASDAGGS